MEICFSQIENYFCMKSDFLLAFNQTHLLFDLIHHHMKLFYFEFECFALNFYLFLFLLLASYYFESFGFMISAYLTMLFKTDSYSHLIIINLHFPTSCLLAVFLIELIFKIHYFFFQMCNSNFLCQKDINQVFPLNIFRIV